MKTFRWKLRYAIAIRRLLRLPPLTCWAMAGSAAEDYGNDTDIWPPEQAAEFERDEWVAGC